MNDIDHKVAPATEVFGKRKQKMLKRREQRMTKNQDLSKFHHVWNSTVRHQLQGPIDKLIQKSISIFKSHNLPGTVVDARNAYSLLNELGSDPDYALSIVSVDYWSDEIRRFEEEASDDQTDKFWNELGDSIDAIADEIVKTKEYQAVRAVCPHIDIESEYIDDYAGIRIVTDGKFVDWVMKQFSSFDSFLVAMESKDSVIGTTIVVGGLLATIGVGILAAKYWYVLVALYGVACVVGAIGNAISERTMKYDKRNPSPEELESLKVFESKWYGIMQIEARHLESALRAVANDIESVNISFNNVPKASKDPYSKMFIPVATITDASMKKQFTPVDNSEAMKRIADTIKEIDFKHNRKIEVKAFQKKKGVFDIGISFNWIDERGFILPNLK